MRNIQVFDEAENALYDIFEVSDDEFDVIFPPGTDIAFIDEVYARESDHDVDDVLESMLERRIEKRDAMGIHGVLFIGFQEKKGFYPTRRDQEAQNLDGSPLR